MLDVDLEGEGIPQEEDEITFAGETESAFFNYLKRGLNFDEDANTVATTAVDAIGSVYSTKTSILSKKYKDIHDKLTEQKQARQNLEEEVKKMKEELQNNQKMIQMQDNNDRANALMATDRVCQMASG